MDRLQAEDLEVRLTGLGEPQAVTLRFSSREDLSALLTAVQPNAGIQASNMLSLESLFIVLAEVEGKLSKALKPKVDRLLNGRRSEIWTSLQRRVPKRLLDSNSCVCSVDLLQCLFIS